MHQELSYQWNCQVLKEAFNNIVCFQKRLNSLFDTAKIHLWTVTNHMFSFIKKREMLQDNNYASSQFKLSANLIDMSMRDW